MAGGALTKLFRMSSAPTPTSPGNVHPPQEWVDPGRVVGSDRYDAAVGSSPAGITFSEWALSNPSAWAYLAPIVTENDGWALFITTARGRNHAKSMLDMAQTRSDWFSEVLPVNVTGAMSETAVEQQRIEYTGIFGKEAADALIDQEYAIAASRRPSSALYWGKEMLLAEQRGAASATCQSTLTCPCIPRGTSASTTLWRSGVSRSTRTTLTSWTITRATVRGFDHYCEWLDARSFHGIDWMPHDAKVREAGRPARTGSRRSSRSAQARAGPRAVH